MDTFALRSLAELGSLTSAFIFAVIQYFHTCRPKSKLWSATSFSWILPNSTVFSLSCLLSRLSVLLPLLQEPKAIISLGKNASHPTSGGQGILLRPSCGPLLQTAPVPASAALEGMKKGSKMTPCPAPLVAWLVTSKLKGLLKPIAGRPLICPQNLPGTVTPFCQGNCQSTSAVSQPHPGWS